MSFPGLFYLPAFGLKVLHCTLHCWIGSQVQTSILEASQVLFPPLYSQFITEQATPCKGFSVLHAHDMAVPSILLELELPFLVFAISQILFS